MKRYTKYTAVCAAFCLLVMIFDSKTALSGATEGVQLCVATVIPTLFPFFVIGSVLTAALSGQGFPIPSKIRSFLGIPQGAEALVLVGFLGGYPVGAQCIARSRANGELTQTDALHLLAFCSNAGPAFLFGIGATLFADIRICWLVWLIHVVAALCVAALGAKGATQAVRPRAAKQPTLTAALEQAVRSMALVCGWIVLFRTVIAFCERWFLWLLPEKTRLIAIGLTELTNGCCALGQIECVGERMRLFSLFLGFGGACVALQTQSVLHVGGLDSRTYFPGKVAQAAISYLLCIPAQLLLPQAMRSYPNAAYIALAAAVCAAYAIYRAKLRKKDSICAAVAL